MTNQFGNAPAGAGLMLLSAIILGTAIGVGLGMVVGAVSILAVLGGFVGLVAGFAFVYQSFKNI